MTMASLIKKGSIVLGVTVAFALFGASSALALSPWWHLTSGSRPTNIRPGSATDEVQEIAVSATAGEMFLAEPIAFKKEELVNSRGEEEFAILPYNASASEVQTGLEKFYGAGNVQVAGGPGDETGSKPYVVTFTGALADRRLEPVNGSISEFLLSCAGASGQGCKARAVVSEKTRGAADGQIVVGATNLGDTSANGQASPIAIADKLPAGLRATDVEANAIIGAGAGSISDGPVQCVLASLTCTFEGSVAGYDNIEMIVNVISEGASTGEMNEASVSGGGAPADSIKRPISVGDAQAGFGAEDYEMTPEEDGGGADTQAGSHMFQLTTTFSVSQTADGNPTALTKDLHFKLPAGLIGNATAIPQCSLKDFLTPVESFDGCPPQTAVGVGLITAFLPAGASVGLQEFKVPVFNIQPAVGEPARFGFFILQSPVILDTAVRTGEDYGVTVNVSNITQTAGFVHNELTFWGVPGDARHDNLRGWGCLFDEHKPSNPEPCNPLEQLHPLPLLSMPTSCSGGPLQTSVEMDSWAEPGLFQTAPSNIPMPTLDGCNRLPFHPSISVVPDGQAASTPTGLTVTEHVPQDVSLDATGLSEAQVKDTTVALPAGVALNPSAADGLDACSEAQVALSVNAPVTCPEASKVATVEIDTPLLPEPIVGEAYLAAQDANPFGSLVALYIVGEDPKAGIIVKVAGEVKPDPITGQLVSTFNGTPQLPFEDLKLHFFGGSRAPLGTPASCGGYTTGASIAPWSGNAPAESSSEFQIISGPNGSACANPLPFSPSLTAGTTSIQAGGFSPFTMTMSRGDGSQNLQAIQLKMPPGLSGLLSSVKLCKEPLADQGLCGPESEIGETIVSVGLGGDPYSVKGGKVYVTEGYAGAPYGLSIVNPAKAGPYDLEANTPCDCVVVRAKIEVDPITAALTIASDNTGPYKIPTILDGIPLQIQHVNVTINRPGFTFNPTNCEPMKITGSLSSTQGATSALSVPLQVTNCAVLGFKPAFSVSTNGKTSRATGASLHVKLVYPKAPFGSQANIKSVKVDLPKQLPSQLKTLQHACPDYTFNQNPAACSTQSRIGTAKATTPLLPVSLTGPVYFVSHAGLKFPELVIVLSGYGTTIDLHAETFISASGITSSTFRTIPDAPVGTFELTLPQGQYPALAAPDNHLCKDKLLMPTAFTAQNGATIKQNTPITVTGCAKAKKAKSKKAAKRKAKSESTGKSKRKK
jgi:hypothetical protein